LALFIKHKGERGMALSEFGAIIRKARIDARIKSLGQMADDLNVSPALLSGMETGRRKISKEWICRIKRYFNEKGVSVVGIEAAADISNESVSLEGLSAEHTMLLVGFARVRDIDADTLGRFRTLLERVQTGGKQVVRKQPS
jgi:plasmid maintenance system antidote protein VapI